MRLEGAIEGRIVPYTVRTQRGKRTKRATRYHTSQRRLAWHMRSDHPGVNLSGPLGLRVRVWVWGSAGDLSNYLKAVEDALQFARIIDNDRTVVRQGPNELHRCAKDAQRLEWELWTVEEA